jgi:hypothetical protein
MTEPVYSCDLDRVWIWEHGHVPRDKMRGKALSQRSYLDGELEVEQILRGKVRHGWVITIDGEGDAWSCGSDYVTYFQTEKPEVVDGRWAGHTVYIVDEGIEEEIERDSTVIDGPHEATWLEVA